MQPAGSRVDGIEACHFCAYMQIQPAFVPSFVSLVFKLWICSMQWLVTHTSSHQRRAASAAHHLMHARSHASNQLERHTASTSQPALVSVRRVESSCKGVRCACSASTGRRQTSRYSGLQFAQTGQPLSGQTSQLLCERQAMRRSFLGAFRRGDSTSLILSP